MCLCACVSVFVCKIEGKRGRDRGEERRQSQIEEKRTREENCCRNCFFWGSSVSVVLFFHRLLEERRLRLEAKQARRAKRTAVEAHGEGSDVAAPKPSGSSKADLKRVVNKLKRAKPAAE